MLLLLGYRRLTLSSIFRRMLIDRGVGEGTESRRIQNDTKQQEPKVLQMVLLICTFNSASVSYRYSVKYQRIKHSEEFRASETSLQSDSGSGENGFEFRIKLERQEVKLLSRNKLFVLFFRCNFYVFVAHLFPCWFFCYLLYKVILKHKLCKRFASTLWEKEDQQLFKMFPVFSL